MSLSARVRRRLPTVLFCGAAVFALAITTGASSLPLLWCSNHARFEVVYNFNRSSLIHATESDAATDYTQRPRTYGDCDPSENIPLKLKLLAPAMVKANAAFCSSVAVPAAERPLVLSSAGRVPLARPDPSTHPVGPLDALRTIRILI